ncbi:MAG: CBS domain-containing protein [Alphaproteobacteria bacterium]|nr:CBS domain-containing protein [Alphaproteobacteria bacterium]
MSTVKQLLRSKGNQVWTVTPRHTVYEAISIMAEKNVGSLLVMDGGKLAGIVTERHYARNVILKGKSSPKTLVGDIMDKKVVCARSTETIDGCMDLMTRRRVRHLPVLEKGELIGIVSIGDVVKSIIDDQNFIIGQLEHYIGGEARVN